MEVVVQVVGALLVLLAFVLTQANRLSTTSRTYLLLNLFGAGVLAVDAALNAQLGFLLLEGVWAVVAGFGLLRSMQTGIGSG